MSRRTGNWLDAYLEVTLNTEPRETYRKWVAISTIASVLQRKCWLEWGTLTFYPNLFIVLVGPPAARKGTAMADGKYFLDRLCIRTAADETSRQALVRALQASSATHQSPTGIVSHHCSLSVFSTELTVFMGYDDKEMLAALCDLFDCKDRFLKDTIGRGEEEVPNVWVNLLGATTPSQLQVSVPSGFVGSGFTSRVIFVYEDEKSRVVVKPSLSPEQKALRERMLLDLEDIHTLCGPFQPDQNFENRYALWRMDADENCHFPDPRLEYYAQRRPLHLFKLCMVHSAARSDSMILTQEDLERSISVLEEAEKKMPQVFAGLGANPLASVQYRLRKLLEERGTVSLSEVARTFETDASHTQLSEAIAALESMGICHIDAANRKLIYRKEKA